MTRTTAALFAVVVSLGATVADAGPTGCPPGLAKKNPPCVPPGLAKQGAAQDRLYRGDYYDRSYDRIRDWDAYGLPPIPRGEGYYRDGRIFYRVDEQTRRVLEWIELTGEILRN
jgi:hypothetical protein